MIYKNYEELDVEDKNIWDERGSWIGVIEWTYFLVCF